MYHVRLLLCTLVLGAELGPMEITIMHKLMPTWQLRMQRTYHSECLRLGPCCDWRRRVSTAEERARAAQGANTQLADMSGDSLIKTAPDVSRTCDSDEAMREQVLACPACWVVCTMPKELV